MEAICGEEEDGQEGGGEGFHSPPNDDGILPLPASSRNPITPIFHSILRACLASCAAATMTLVAAMCSFADAELMWRRMTDLCWCEKSHL